MTEQLVLRQFQQLPENMKQEVLDFIGYLWSKYNTQKPQKNRPKFGSAKGKYQMSADFDAPLDIFKDYME
jgi:hypothetical protein